MNARIRLAGPDDARALARLRWNMHTEEEPSPEPFETFVARFRPFAEAALQSPSWRIWVAEIRPELVANMWLQIVPRVPRPMNASSAPLAYLTNVYVEKVHRNAGLGSRMLREVTSWCQAHPVSVVVVWPSDEAVAYYRRAGFEPSDALQLAFDDDQYLILLNESATGETF